MKADKVKPRLPKNPAPYLTAWLFEIGPTSASGEREVAIGWDTLSEWQRNVGVELLPWEARMLRSLSREFVHQRELSRKPDCAEPCEPKAYPITDPQRVDRQFAAMFRAFAARAKSA